MLENTLVKYIFFYLKKTMNYFNAQKLIEHLEIEKDVFTKRPFAIYNDVKYPVVYLYVYFDKIW